jgi:hypothetical protein
VDGGAQAAVRAAFDLSYAVLRPSTRRLFRLLGLVSRPEITVPAAAALAGTNPAGTHLIDVHARDGCTRPDVVDRIRNGTVTGRIRSL